jgi:hypothetical protein
MPAGHEHTPLAQAAPLGHALQPPQCAVLERISTQALPVPHAPWPVGHAHAPIQHDWSLGQACPQAPQFCELPVVSTQELPQRVNVPAHPEAQWPCEHTSPAPHAVPQAPQFFASDDVSTHAPEHVVCPVAHPHTAAWHTCPALHACPHAPQLVALVAVSTQPPAHVVVPAPHAATDDEVPALLAFEDEELARPLLVEDALPDPLLALPGEASGVFVNWFSGAAVEQAATAAKTAASTNDTRRRCCVPMSSVSWLSLFTNGRQGRTTAPPDRCPKKSDGALRPRAPRPTREGARPFQREPADAEPLPARRRSIIALAYRTPSSR